LGEGFAVTRPPELLSALASDRKKQRPGDEARSATEICFDP
jgi:hypothetical protein